MTNGVVQPLVKAPEYEQYLHITIRQNGRAIYQIYVLNGEPPQVEIGKI